MSQSIGHDYRKEAFDTLGQIRAYLGICLDPGLRDDLNGSVTRLRSFLGEDDSDTVFCSACNVKPSKCGHTAKGTQRYRCSNPDCRRFKIPFVFGRDRNYGNHRLDQDKLNHIVKLLQSGESIRHTAELAKANVHTVRRIHREFEIAVACPCGEPANHQGWCKVRLARSPARQEFLRQWHKVQMNAVGV